MLPIEPHLAPLTELIQQHPVTLLEASPGSGKTTLVPLHLMRTFKGKILVLEPRRMATRWAATRVVELSGEPLGESVGYMYRFENKTSLNTRLVFLTEGTFLQYIKANPDLAGVDAVVLDEFHERHLTTDIAFGLLVELSLRLKSPPRLLIMSATLNEAPLLQHFPNLKKYLVTTPVYPLEIRWAPNDVEWQKRELDRKVLWGIQEALQLKGDILVFLPGLGEIKRLEDILNERLKDQGYLLLKLHGQESSPDHLLMKPQSERRIILASNVAESSVTIPGVRIVVDAGLQREAIFSAWSSLTELVTLPSSKASAIQRAGRAARTSAGICIRLYTEAEFNQRTAFTTPEIHKTDLASVLLDLAFWKISPSAFPWPEAPAPALLLRAQELLATLSAVENNVLTAVGHEMQSVPLPVRHARVWVEAKLKGTAAAFQETCQALAAFLEKAGEVRRLAQRLMQRQNREGNESAWEKFFLVGFSDHIAKGRALDVVTVTGETYRLSHEVKNIWDPKRNFWLVIDINPLHKSVTRLMPLEDDWVYERAQISNEQIFDENRQKMIRRETWKLGAITLKSIDHASSEKSAIGVLSRSAQEWLQVFKDSPEFIRWILFQRYLFPEKSIDAFEWELFMEEFLLDDRLPTPEVEKDFLQRLRNELQLYFDASFQQKISTAFPSSIQLHDKRKCDVHYELNQPPWIEAYIQDFFGMKTHPCLLNGKISLTIHLWGPHGRSQQVT
jgi:ATP-dependent helicase HrpB